MSPRRQGQVLVNDVYQTNVENIYDYDVTDRVQLTPVAIEEGMCIANNLFTENPPKKPGLSKHCYCGILPTQYRHCGFNEAEAIAEYADLDIYESDFKPMKHT